MSAGVFHGGALDAAIAEFGGERSDWIDLSTGINPEPYPVPDLPVEVWSRLPDQSAMQMLEDVARRYYRVPDDFSVVAAPGTQSLIEILPPLLPGKTATIIAPSTGVYAEHAYCSAKSGRNITRAENPDQVDRSESFAVLVHPNNPDGHVWPIDSVGALVSNMQGSGHLVIDEAFCDTMPDHSLVPNMQSNMIVLRSFGKFFGLAGLRLGFAVCSKEIAAKIRSRLGPWAVSGPALAIGTMALSDQSWIKETRSMLKRKSAALAQTLETAGLGVIGANPLFILVQDKEAGKLHKRLNEQYILARAFSDRPNLLRFGLPVGEHELNRLVAALSPASGTKT